MDDSLDLLQLPLPSVRERVEQELQENPVLELRDPATTEAALDNETADIVMDRSDIGGYDLRLSDQPFSDLFISQRYTELEQAPAVDPRAKEYLGRKLRSARCLLEAVECRRRILRRVAEAVFRQQRAFLERGPSHIAPLDVEQVAAEVGVDALTILRAVQGKQVRTPHGVLNLDRFVLQPPTPSSN
jgi:RNA polymerase sigma-54 factor